MIKEALVRSRGMIAVAARMLGCRRQTLYDSIARNPDIKEVVGGERDLFVDTAELKLIEAVQKGDLAAVMFCLRTLGKNRGYVERQDVHHTGQVSLEQLVLKSSPPFNGFLQSATTGKQQGTA